MQDEEPPQPLWRTLRELPRPVIVLLTGVAVNRMGSLVQIFLILYLTSIGFSPARAGLALTAYGAGSIAGVFASGLVCDRIGPRQAIVAAMVGSGVLVAMLPLVHAYAPLVGLCIGAGAAAQLYRPASLAMLASLTPRNRLVITTAAYRLGLNVGVTLAPLIGILLAARSYTLVFLTDAATSLAFSVVALLALPRQAPESAKRHSEAGQADGGQADGGYRALLRDRRFLIVIASMLAIALAEVQYQSVLPLQIKARGLPTVLYAAVLAINGAMVILLELPSTAYIRRLPIRTSISTGTILIGLGMSLFGLPAGTWLFITGAIVWTAGEIISAPSTSAYPALIAPPRLRGRYIGALNTSQTLGYAAGPALGTALFQFIGSGMWLMCLVLGLVAGIGMWIGIASPGSQDSPAADGRSHHPLQAET